MSLAAGSHTAALQWKAQSSHESVPWLVLNGIDGFFQASFERMSSYKVVKVDNSRQAAAEV